MIANEAGDFQNCPFLLYFEAGLVLRTSVPPRQRYLPKGGLIFLRETVSDWSRLPDSAIVTHKVTRRTGSSVRSASCVLPSSGSEVSPLV